MRFPGEMLVVVDDFDLFQTVTKTGIDWSGVNLSNLKAIVMTRLVTSYTDDKRWVLHLSKKR